MEAHIPYTYQICLFDSILFLLQWAPLLRLAPASTTPPMASMLGMPDMNPDIMQGILTGVYDVPGLRPVSRGEEG